VSDPSIPSQGFGFGGAGGADDGISLSLGLETTGGLGGFDPVPEGTHMFQIEEPPEVSFTSGGEHMLTLKLKVVQSNVPGAQGMAHTERLVIPGADRRASEPDKWATMMKILRTKLEAITNTPWREDNIKLQPRALSGCKFIATVKHKTNTYTDKESGEQKEGTNADLSKWTPVTAGVAGPTAPVGNGAVVSGAQMAQAVTQGFGAQAPAPAPAEPAQQAQPFSL
jgi:hypothetical protein